MNIDPSFRALTSRIILINTSNLIIKTNAYSFVQRKHLDAINKLYYSILSHLKVMIMNKKVIRDFGYELFEREWESYIVDINSVIKQLIATPYLLVPFNLEDSIEDFPAVLKIQKSDQENFRSMIMTFIMLYDLRNNIYKDNRYIKDKFPLKIGEEDVDLYKRYILKGKFNLFFI